MDNRRFALWLVLSLGFYLLWINIAPRFFPGVFKAPVPEELVDLDEPEPVIEPPAAELLPLAAHPRRTATLGEGGYKAGYMLTVKFTSAGGAIESIELNDPRYTTLDRKQKFQIIGNPVEWVGQDWALKRSPRTWETAVPQIDEQLKPHHTSLLEADWQLVPAAAGVTDEVTFSYTSPDQALQVLKTYRVHPVQDPANATADAYVVDIEFELKNLGADVREASYVIQGPTGIQVENQEIARVYREIKVGTRSVEGDFTALHVPASTVFDQVKDSLEPGAKAPDSWNEPIQYAGIDVQFFGALIIPEDQLLDRDGDKQPDPTLDSVHPQLLYGDSKKTLNTDISITLNSRPVKLPAGESVKHRYQFFAGPKRPDLLAPFGASEVIHFGTVPFIGWIPPLSWNPYVAHFIMWFLTFLHDTAGVHYALCIILITAAVRGVMFPLSVRQAASAERMKVFAPEMKKLQEKYKDRPEEYPRALSEFNRKHNVPNPVMGCLPVLLQMPIFFGLYGALGQAVDLRLAKFLWIDNLAGQDALFHLPFTVPWFGWTEFNVLPIISVALFIIQFKMMSPPPTNDEQEFQQKFQLAMMLAIGFAFYTVPAGLCLYIIVSSVWGLAERMLIKRLWPHIFEQKFVEEGAPVVINAKGATTASAAAPPSAPRQPNWFERLLAAADEAKNSTQAQGTARNEPKNGGKKKPKK